MGDVIQFKPHLSATSPTNHDELNLTPVNREKVEQIRDAIESSLEGMALNEDMPLTVAMAAGRYAAMRMFLLQGRAETMAFMDQCIITAEMCDDLARQLDEDA